MLIDKLKKLGISHSNLTAQQPAAPKGHPPNKQSIYRNRANFGVNFGSLFVQESFIYGKFFPNGSNTEYSGISAYIKEHGLEQTKRALEEHWQGYATDNDWEWLQSVGVTSVRIPIGYWHVKSGEYTKGTPFAEISEVYERAWDILKKIVTRANDYGIGVLIDLHALPGGANCSEHSGVENKRAEFWQSSKYQKLALSALEFITRDLKSFTNVVGLQVVNECEFSNDPKEQQEYYTRALATIRSVDPTLPMVISDGWWTDQWIKWINEQESKFSNGGSAGIIIDTHVYRCFSDADKNKSPEQIIRDLDGDLLTNLSDPGADIMVGEYSCVLDGSSWGKARGDRGQLVKQYGVKQQELFRQRSQCGSYFWTLKFEHGDGGEWGFYPMVNSGAIPQRRGVKVPSEKDGNAVLERELKQHSEYWDGQNRKEKYEHWRYREGFVTGWADSVEFARFGGSAIGRRKAWRSARLLEHLEHRGSSRFVWEWEQGFNRALDLVLLG